jgi:hypothetical protein
MIMDFIHKYMKKIKKNEIKKMKKMKEKQIISF